MQELPKQFVYHSFQFIRSGHKNQRVFVVTILCACKIHVRAFRHSFAIEMCMYVDLVNKKNIFAIKSYSCIRVALN